MRRRITLGVLAAVALLAAAGIVAAAHDDAAGGKPSSERARQVALAIKNHTAPGRLEKAITGDSREVVNGPAQEDYSNRAYPNKTIAAAQVMGAEQADGRVRGRGDRGHGRWRSIGPDTLNVDTLGTQTFGPPTQWSGRVTAIAVSPRCSVWSCRVYVAAAGGGVWLSNNALSSHPSWRNVTDFQIPSTSIGTILIDPTDPSGRTIYVGTGEPNGSSDSEAGVGLYRSTDGGEHWSLVPGSYAVAKDRGIGAIAVDPSNPSHIFIGTAVARHGLSSESGGRYTPPNAPPVGLYESKDGGATFAPNTILDQDTVNPGSANGSDFYRGGVTDIEYDPTVSTTLYFSVWDHGVFRSDDNGATHAPIYAQAAPTTRGTGNDVRYQFATAKLAGGLTRMYLLVGSTEEPSSLLRTDDARVAAPVWQELSAPNPADPGAFASHDICPGQCWYDLFVESPAGRPDTVVIGGSMQYPELPPYAGPDRSNGRGVQLSTDAGKNFTDMTAEAANRPGLRFDGDAMHPDQHALAFDRANPDIMFVGNDGGIVRTSGAYADDSAECDSRGLSGTDLTDCKAWLSKIPTRIYTLNAGLNTLQFQQLSVDWQNPLNDLLGGTQDNGTLAYTGSPTWLLPVTGDGGDSGIDPVRPATRFHTYTNAWMDVNFHGNTPATWDWIADPLYFSPDQSAFYAPATQDPVVGGQIFVGYEHVYRTQDSGGDPAFLDAHCNTTGQFGTSDKLFTGECGDFKVVSPNLANDPAYGSKAGSYISAIERGMDANTLWVGTRRGRIFISRDASSASPTYTRIDTDAEPKRLPSGISVDPTNPLHAFITYSGYNAYALASGTAPGHVFEVTVNPTTLTATWTLLDYNLGDQPITDVAYDQPTGDLYVSTDWGVDRLPAGSTSWVTAADGMPPVAVYGLTYAKANHGKRVLYAATHGRGAYRLYLKR